MAESSINNDARSLKEEGNASFAAKDYQKALAPYQEALGSLPSGQLDEIHQILRFEILLSQQQTLLNVPDLSFDRKRLELETEILQHVQMYRLRLLLRITMSYYQGNDYEHARLYLRQCWDHADAGQKLNIEKLLRHKTCTLWWILEGRLICPKCESRWEGRI